MTTPAMQFQPAQMRDVRLVTALLVLFTVAFFVALQLRDDARRGRGASCRGHEEVLGIVLIDKPIGITSHDVVNAVRQLWRVERTPVASADDRNDAARRDRHWGAARDAQVATRKERRLPCPDDRAKR